MQRSAHSTLDTLKTLLPADTKSVELKQAKCISDFKMLASSLLADDLIYPELLREDAIRTEYVKQMDSKSFHRVVMKYFKFYNEHSHEEPIKSFLLQLINILEQLNQANQDSQAQANEYKKMAAAIGKLLALRGSEFIKQRDLILKMLEANDEVKEMHEKLKKMVLVEDRFIKEKVIDLLWGRDDVIKLYKEGKLIDPACRGYHETERLRKQYFWGCTIPNAVSYTDIDFYHTIRKFVPKDEYAFNMEGKLTLLEQDELAFISLKPHLDTTKPNMQDHIGNRTSPSLEFVLRMITYSEKLREKDVTVKPDDFNAVVNLLQNQADLTVEIAELKNDLEFFALMANPNFSNFFELSELIFSNKECLNNTKMFVAARMLGLCLYVHQVKPGLADVKQASFLQALRKDDTEREQQALREMAEMYRPQPVSEHMKMCLTRYSDS